MKITKNVKAIFQNRIAIMKILVIIIGVVFSLRLIQLQIVNGTEYREKSEKKMARATVIEAPRGEIYDKNGLVLATSVLGYDVEIYRTKIDNLTLNKTILKVIKILKKNGDTFNTTLPIEKGKLVFYNNKQEINLYDTFKFDKSLNGDKILKLLYEKYELNDTEFTEEEKLNITAIRYEMNINPFTLFRSIVIAENISYESMAMIEEVKSELYGVTIRTTPKRSYPNLTLASHLLGYVGIINSEEYSKLKDKDYSYNSIVGKMGVEATMEPYLKGINGIMRSEVNVLGEVSSDYIYKEATSGNNVTLTIDYRLQKVAEESLKQVIQSISTGTNGYKKYSTANAGTVVALDVNTGEVLAMASYPTFDPNLFISGIKYSDWKKINENTIKPMFNRAIAGTYSPGSTFKMLTAIAGLETKAINTTELIKDTGIYAYGHHPRCWIYSDRGATHGSINVSQAIKVSCNVYFYEVGRRMGISNLVKYAKLFGLGDKTGIELYGESKGSIAGANEKTKWYLGDTLSAAIGQSYNSYTPLQLANYISTLANGGTLRRVSVIKNISDGNNKSISEDEINEHVEKITGVKFETQKIELDKKNVEAVVNGMASVTSETGGTSYIVFKNADIEVAGKTGTAQVSSGVPNGIFVGYAPIKNPQIAVVAIIEHGYSGTNTANVVKAILEEYFNISEKGEMEENSNVSEQSVTY